MTDEEEQYFQVNQTERNAVLDSQYYQVLKSILHKDYLQGITDTKHDRQAAHTKRKIAAEMQRKAENAQRQQQEQNARLDVEKALRAKLKAARDMQEIQKHVDERNRRTQLAHDNMLQDAHRQAILSQSTRSPQSAALVREVVQSPPMQQQVGQRTNVSIKGAQRYDAMIEGLRRIYPNCSLYELCDDAPPLSKYRKYASQ